MISSLRKILGERLFWGKISRQVDEMVPFLPPRGSVLDLGVGKCLVTKSLRGRGYDAHAVDIEDHSYYADIRPTIYDGLHLPFPDKSFDACLLIAVLHHAADDTAVLREAMRVAPKIVIYEDIFKNRLQKGYIRFVDSALNREFFGHIHHNRRDEEWRTLFSFLGLTLERTTYTRTWGWIDNATYYLSVQP